MKLTAFALMMTASVAAAQAETRVKLLTLDPGHFHASLIQKSMYPQVDPVVHVYSPGGADLEGHLERIDSFNTRAESPTQWKEVIYTGEDYLERMLREKAGNVVVISGNNSLKGKYILGCVKAGLNVLSDKPMAITPADFLLLKEAFAAAPKTGALLYDIMPERSEITSVLQRELAQQEAVFGIIEAGTPEDPAILQEDVHYFLKEVAGKTLVRPAWFFDMKQQGAGIVDVTTHAVDLVQCSLFPEQVIDPKDAHVLSARTWSTQMSPGQFETITQLAQYPDSLKPYQDGSGNLQVRSNGSFVYTLRGIHARVTVEWRVQAPFGEADTHFSLMRGSNADLVIRQGPEEKFTPTLYVSKRSKQTDAEFESALKSALRELDSTWPGLEVARNPKGWAIVIPEKHRKGHEARFADVASTYFRYLQQGKIPEWETAGMLTKYSTLMQAYALSRPDRP